MRGQGRTPRGGGARGPGPPFGTWKTPYFQGFFRKITRFASLKSVFLSFLLCGRNEAACRMIKSLRKIDFSHPTGHHTWKKFAPPWENPGCAPVRGCSPPPTPVGGGKSGVPVRSGLSWQSFWPKLITFIMERFKTQNNARLNDLKEGCHLFDTTVFTFFLNSNPITMFLRAPFSDIQALKHDFPNLYIFAIVNYLHLYFVFRAYCR